MQERSEEPRAGFYRVSFLRAGKRESSVFTSYVIAFSYYRSLHSSKRATIEPAPELDGVVVTSATEGQPAGVVVVCPRGPRVRTFMQRKPRTIRRFPDFSSNVLNMPRQSAGFFLTYPEEPSERSEVLKHHNSIEEATLWTQERYGEKADGEWWPKKQGQEAKVKQK